MASVKGLHLRGVVGRSYGARRQALGLQHR